MKSLGLPIPDGFTISTETCDIYYKNNKTYPQEVLDQIEDHLQALKKDDIMTQIANPENRWEIRKWVWLVFRRVMEKKK